MDIIPSRGALGAEIHGIDLSEPLGDNAVAAVRQALLDHLVIVFRDQKLSIAQHKAFAENFGRLQVFTFRYARPLGEHPEVLRVVKEKHEREVFAGEWHADVTFMEKPSLGSLLYALETPPVGGDTLFANMYLAYETLSDTMKSMVENLVCAHETEVPDQADLASGHLKRYGTEHPVVATHPETGRKLLFVNKTYSKQIKGMTPEESDALLGFLCRHATRAEHVWRVQWRPGTLTFWDNRVTQHRPMNDYHGHRREMHRVTVEREDRVA